MSGRHLDRMCLGSVQLGIDYGISNKKGMVPSAEAHDMLGYAFQKGVRFIDTAADYGKSEEVIGEFTKNSGNYFKVITKVSASPGSDRAYLEESIYTSLDRLNADRLYGVLVHSFGDFLNNSRVWDAVSALRQKGLIEKTGFSLYKPLELEMLFERGISFDLIQIPFSVFDRRFVPYLKRLKGMEVEIHARSVFLQGLAFMGPEQLPECLKGAGGAVRNLRSASAREGLPLHKMCIDAVLSEDLIDKVIVGVDGFDQLKDNIGIFSTFGRTDTLQGMLAGSEIEDEDILMPYRWRLKRVAEFQEGELNA
ncbi:MAG: hypothetical protein GF409_04795 [Candidatus Omnitrophica bacterium]|nr:hypothetical protein [Candidatus Omnitrophota bacterium]